MPTLIANVGYAQNNRFAKSFKIQLSAFDTIPGARFVTSALRGVNDIIVPPPSTDILVGFFFIKFQRFNHCLIVKRTIVPESPPRVDQRPEFITSKYVYIADETTVQQVFVPKQTLHSLKAKISNRDRNNTDRVN